MLKTTTSGQVKDVEAALNLSSMSRKVAATVKKYQEALSSWDDLKKRISFEKDTGGQVTEDEIEAARFRRERPSDVNKFVD